MKNIALSFSGGGFRAAAYSLGCLSYLNSIELGAKPLLQRVSYVSSTSGGSITNLVYNRYIYTGKSFDECYAFLKSRLQGDQLLDKALKILNDTKCWEGRPEKSRNLINAFSLAYEGLFEGDSFSVFSTTTHRPHVEEICVNSTEFTNGQAFRFQSQNPDLLSHGRIGNGYIHFKPGSTKDAGAVKLSDILAASSCFPSGFEPMIFPKDFANADVGSGRLRDALVFRTNEYTLDPYNHLSVLSDKEFRREVEFGLMDGGVADNQAIDAFITAEDRRNENRGSKEPVWDLYICCDVTSHLMDGYTLPIQKKHILDFISIRSLLCFLSLVALWLPLMLLLYKSAWQPWQYVTGTLSAIPLSVLLYLLYSRIKSLFIKKKARSTWTVALNRHKGKLLALSVGAARKMLAARVKSVFILANDVYLKQIRRQYYEALFRSSRYKYRTIQNTIYDLSRAKIKSDKMPVPAPSQRMIDMAEQSRTMATTLWFDRHHMEKHLLEGIIATGQFTTCYNLIRHINEKVSNKTVTAEELELLPKLMKDWDAFCKVPNHLV